MRIRTGDWFLGAALLASLASNGYFVQRWRAHPARSAQANALAPESTSGISGTGALAIANAWRQALPGLRAAGPAPAPSGTPVRLDHCELRRATLVAQIADLAQVREARLPPATRFDEAPANAQLTGAFSAALRAELASAGVDGGGFLAECHGRLCRLTLPKSANQSEWLARFAASEWMGENLHEVSRDDDGVLYAQHTPGAVRGSELLQQALQDFEAGGAIEACQSRFSGEGTLDAQVTLEPSEEGAASGDAAEVVAGGRLAGTPLGNCIDTEFRQALRARTLPPHYEHASLLARFPKP